MKAIGFFYPPFMTHLWTTIGDTIYYPDGISFPLKPKYYRTIQHEIVHIKQFKRYGIPLFLFLYIFFPLPILFSYFRWKFEREAYSQVNINNEEDVERVVDSLAKHYLYPWPKTWMRKWFLKELERLEHGENSR